jgi:hypothetical protein
MKIKEQALREMILEEYYLVLSELNACHSKQDGTLSSCASGDSYSLSEPAVRAAGWKSEKAGKGKITSKGKVSPRYGMATGPKACGRKTVKGDKISPKYKCAKYPERYSEGDHPLVPSIDDAETDRREKLGYPKHLQALGKGIIRADEMLVDHENSYIRITMKELMEIVSEALVIDSDVTNEEMGSEGSVAALQAKCRQMGFTSAPEAQRRILIALNNFHRASDGRLFEPAKK